MRNTPNTATAARVVSLADEEAVKDILATTVLDLWKVVNNLTRLRPSKHERYRVAIFGSAWKGLVEWARTAMLDPRLALARPEDLQIPRCLETADEAIAIVGELHAKRKARP